MDQRDGPLRVERDLAIEGLRGLAALTVLTTHLGGELARESRIAAALIWPAEPAAAVMIFFVLSGYVIGLATPGVATPARVRMFAWRRIVRLWPISLAGVLLGCAVATQLDAVTVLGNVFALQNFTDYFGAYVPVLPTNFNLWSLNYEVVYYAAFTLLWWSGLRIGRVAAGTALLGLATWFGPARGVFVACYAFGFLFWLGGLAIARHGERRSADRVNWPSWLLVALATWKLSALRDVMLALPLPKPYFAGPVVRLYYLDFLPVSLVLVAVVSRSMFPLRSGLQRIALAIAAAGVAGHVAANPAWLRGEGAAIGATLGLALVLWRWTPTLRAFRIAAPVGLISYALYATSRPIQEWIFEHRAVFGAGFAGTLTAAIVVLLASVAVAWYLERRLQPALAHGLFRRPSGPHEPAPVTGTAACSLSAGSAAER